LGWLVSEEEEEVVVMMIMMLVVVVVVPIMYHIPIDHMKSQCFVTVIVWGVVAVMVVDSKTEGDMAKILGHLCKDWSSSSTSLLSPELLYCCCLGDDDGYMETISLLLYRFRPDLLLTLVTRLDALHASLAGKRWHRSRNAGMMVISGSDGMDGMMDGHVDVIM